MLLPLKVNAESSTGVFTAIDDLKTLAMKVVHVFVFSLISFIHGYPQKDALLWVETHLPFHFSVLNDCNPSSTFIVDGMKIS